jgi:hypothetical protein
MPAYPPDDDEEDDGGLLGASEQGGDGDLQGGELGTSAPAVEEQRSRVIVTGGANAATVWGGRRLDAATATGECGAARAAGAKQGARRLAAGVVEWRSRRRRRLGAVAGSGGAGGIGGAGVGGVEEASEEPTSEE